MLIRIVADEEPYISYRKEGNPTGFLSFHFESSAAWGKSGTAANCPKADLYVLPAQLYLELPSDSKPRPCFVYGPEGLMDQAFRQGCEDFLRNPWGWTELLARARRLMVFRFTLREFHFEAANRSLSSAGKAISLTEGEYSILRILLSNLNAIIPRTAMCRVLWDSPHDDSRTPDVHISALRKKLDMLAPGSALALKAIRGQGYRLSGERCG